MPQYHGPVRFLVDVLAHLVRNYLAWMFVFAIVLPSPFFLWAIIAVGVEETLRTWPPLTLASVSSWFSFAHVMTFLMFRHYFSPRFPYASPYLTFAIAAPVGAALVGTNWMLNGGGWAGDALLNKFEWAGVVTAGAAILGALIAHLGGTGALHWGPGRWFGWLVVGRAAFEAFLEQDAERLEREYDAYARSVRK